MIECKTYKNIIPMYPDHKGPMGITCIGCAMICDHARPEDWVWNPAEVAMCKELRHAKES